MADEKTTAQSDTERINAFLEEVIALSAERGFEALVVGVSIGNSAACITRGLVSHQLGILRTAEAAVVSQAGAMPCVMPNKHHLN